MRRIRRVLVLGIMVLAIVTFWSYRKTVATVEAAAFRPVDTVLPPIPAGTEIQAVLAKSLSRASKAGDPVTAFVWNPVMVHGAFVLPSGVRLNGVVEQIDQDSGKATIRLRFNEIVMNGTSSPMETERVVTKAWLRSDSRILKDAMNTIMSAGVGLAVGTAARDPKAIAAGLALGAYYAVPGPTLKSPLFTVKLAEPLSVRT
jgi:hypothetical protein